MQRGSKIATRASCSMYSVLEDDVVDGRVTTIVDGVYDDDNITMRRM